MGLNILGSGNQAEKLSGPMVSLSGGIVDSEPKPPEPNAKKFEVLEAKSVNGWTVAVIHYPGCTTYEGKKCLVFACPPGVVKRQELLDPHFLEREDRLSPIARFEPTERGIDLAIQLCTNRPKRERKKK
jgi:hypothetical protein